MDTIGILCAQGAKTPFLRALPRQLRALPADEPLSVLVFSLSELHMEERMIGGVLVTGEGVRAAWSPLPAVIFNAAVQHRRSSIRTLRALLELPDCRVLNPSNRFDQRQVREMLVGDPALAQAVPPEAGDTPLESLPAFVRRPIFGSRVDRVVCGRVVCSSHAGKEWELFNWGDAPVSRISVDALSSAALSSANDKTDAAAPGSAEEEMTLRLPPPRARAGRPFATRALLQKAPRGEWEILRHGGLFPPGRSDCPVGSAGKKLLLAAAGRVGCFLPDMALCTADLFWGEDGAPFLIGMGGWPGEAADVRAAIKTRRFGDLLGYARRISHN